MILYEPVILIGLLGGLVDSIRRREFFYQFVVFCAVITLAIFSYTGEKFPWLLMCPLALCALAAGIYYGKNFLEFRWWWKTTIILLAIFTVFNSVRLNFFNAADTNEMTVYVQTPIFAQSKIAEAVRACEQPQIKDCVAIEQKITWPLSWYFRRSSYLFTGANAQVKPTTKYIFVASESINSFQKPINYIQERYYLRDWWVPDVCRKVSCAENFLEYFLFRKTWNVKGGYDVFEFIKQ